MTDTDCYYCGNDPATCGCYVPRCTATDSHGLIECRRSAFHSGMHIGYSLTSSGTVSFT